MDPRPLDHENVPCNLLQKIVFGVMYGTQGRYEEQLKKLGLKSDTSFSCTCYMDQVGNLPKKGDILSWAESSARGVRQLGAGGAVQPQLRLYRPVRLRSWAKPLISICSPTKAARQNGLSTSAPRRRRRPRSWEAPSVSR